MWDKRRRTGVWVKVENSDFLPSGICNGVPCKRVSAVCATSEDLNKPARVSDTGTFNIRDALRWWSLAGSIQGLIGAPHSLISPTKFSNKKSWICVLFKSVELGIDPAYENITLWLPNHKVHKRFDPSSYKGLAISGWFSQKKHMESILLSDVYLGRIERWVYLAKNGRLTGNSTSWKVISFQVMLDMYSAEARCLV